MHNSLKSTTGKYILLQIFFEKLEYHGNITYSLQSLKKKSILRHQEDNKMTLGLPAEKGLYPAIHSVSAFTISNTLTETWRGVSVIWSSSSADKYIVCIFDYLHVPEPTAF